MSENTVKANINRRMSITEKANKVLSAIALATGLDEGVIVSSALEAYAATDGEAIAELIRQDAETRANNFLASLE